MIYTLTLNPAIDCVLYGETFSPGAVNRARREDIHPGGKGINVAVVLHELGCPVRALGFAAGWTGDALLAELQRRGIACDFVRLREGETRINIKLRADTETEINAPGPSVGEEDLTALLEKLEQVSAGDTVILSGSAPASMTKEARSLLLGGIAQSGARLIADLTGDFLTEALRFRPFLVKPNASELAVFCGRPLADTADTVRAAKQMQSAGAKNVLVSRGAAGALLLKEDGSILLADPLPVTEVYSVGAGDSMVAGFAAGYEAGESEETALRLANAAGAATAASRTLAQRDDILALLADSRVRTVAL